MNGHREVAMTHRMIDDVRTFLLASGGEPIPPQPIMVNKFTKALWDKLRREELREFSTAFDELHFLASAYSDDQIDEAYANLAKELVDVIYVFIGTALRYGIPLDAVWDEVQRSNMAKVSGDVRRRDDGKILKPEGWTPPDILSIVRRVK